MEIGTDTVVAGYELDGDLDETVFWDDVLDGDAATALYNGGVGRFLEWLASIAANKVQFMWSTLGRRLFNGF